MKTVYMKYTLNAQKTRQHKDKRANPLLNKQPIYKVNQKQSVVLYIHPSPIHKIIQKRIFDSLISSFDIIESSPIPFLL